MITAGIDMGAKTVKVVIMDDGKIIGKSLILAGIDTQATAKEAFEEALKGAGGLDRGKIEKIVATGAGHKEAPYATGEITEVGAAAKGACFLVPSCQTVIDVGAEEGRAIRCKDGKVVDFAINEKCAAGAGAFTEAMARAIEVSLEELGPLSLTSQNAVAMNAQCAVFAESEVVTLVHNKTPKEDMARAVHDAIASRIISMVRKVGFEEDIVLIGGVARNVGFVDSMKRGLERKIIVPEDPDYVGAVGAAVAAAGE